MSLLCSQTERDIEFGQPLYAALREAGNSFYALSEEAIEKIPASERRKESAKAGEGENLYVGTSTRNFNGSYTITGFKIDTKQFLFSISNETAERYLPIHVRRCSSDKAA